MKIGMAAALLIALCSAPASASTSTAFRSWLSETVQSRVDAMKPLEASPNEIATIGFEAVPGLSPRKVRVAQSSGSDAVDQAAAQIVSSLPSLLRDAPAGEHFVVLSFEEPTMRLATEAVEYKLRKAQRQAQRTAREQLARGGGSSSPLRSRQARTFD